MWAELIFFIFKKAAAVITAINIALQLISPEAVVKISIPSLIVTTIITATALTFTASRKIEKTLEFLSLGTIGLIIRTKIKEGRKIPAVAIKAPQIPAI